MWFAPTTIAAIGLSSAVTAFQAPKGCQKLAPAPVASSQLPSLFNGPSNLDIHTFVETKNIRRTLSLCAIIIDGRDYESLSNVFTEDAIANYSTPLGVLAGLNAINTSIAARLQFAERTQHLLDTQLISICGPKSDAAVSVTYY